MLHNLTIESFMADALQQATTVDDPRYEMVGSEDDAIVLAMQGGLFGLGSLLGRDLVDRGARLHHVNIVVGFRRSEQRFEIDARWRISTDPAEAMEDCFHAVDAVEETVRYEIELRWSGITMRAADVTMRFRHDEWADVRERDLPRVGRRWQGSEVLP